MVSMEKVSGLYPSQPTELVTKSAPRSPVWDVLFAPIVAPLLAHRWVAFMLTGIGIAQLMLVGFGLPGWPCPLRMTLGIPCPGCGLSTAMAHFLRGDWTEALTIHAFAPIFLLGMLIMFIVSCLPATLHSKVVSFIADLERRTGAISFVLLGAIIYWVVRLIRRM